MKHFLLFYEGAADYLERRPQFRSAHLRYPDNTSLSDLIAEILDLNADARQLWANPLTSLPPTASERWLNLGPSLAPCRIHVVTLEPDLAPGHRLTILVPETARPHWPVATSSIPDNGGRTPPFATNVSVENPR